MLFRSSLGGELEQIQFLLGHVSIQTTERYLLAQPEFWLGQRTASIKELRTSYNGCKTRKSTEARWALNCGIVPSRHRTSKPSVCAYCGQEAVLTVDHIPPKALYPKSLWPLL